ncbi:MAG: DNA repair protein RecO [Candidatus Cloacimonetes bacterium]|nr:DNA repair protein RecO [Candidatus Cloacimonadota bacterium]MDD2507231.1 DNA repair protein RecO [Candidatus Cloacimonadota bacterium]MDD4560633.1 DNA repair protein RecO [Candidatus Cloacimonadota bacterium]
MIKTNGIILGLIPFSESSQILRIFSAERAQISIIAKGWLKKQEPLLRFAEYEFNLYEPKEEGLYILKEAVLLQDYSQYPSTSTWAAAEAGAELISKILISGAEAGDYYTLLKDYLGYLQKLDSNAILIFWRLLLKIFKLLGINIELNRCCVCNTVSGPAGFSGASEIICETCIQQISNRDYYTVLSPAERRILSLLPEIGKHLDTIKPDAETVNKLNGFFLAYYTAQQKQTLTLKSLSVLSQFYQ